MQQARYIPSASIPVAAAQAAVMADLASYQGIYYQMGQPDVTFAMETSLDTQTASYPLDKTPFFAFAYGAYVYLSALATMQQVTPTLSGATKVSDLWDQYGVSAAQLFDANQNTLVTKLFDDSALAVPQMYATVQSDSLQSIVNDPQWQSFHLTVPGLAVLNQEVSLGAGGDLSAPTTRTVAATATDSLNSVAQRAHAAVAALGVANAGTAGLWRQGAVFTVGTKQYTMGANDKLADAAQALNVTVEALALANQWLTNIFAGNVTLQVNDIAISDGDTLASLAQLVSTDVPTLANANANVGNLFAPATEIQIGLETQPAPPSGTDTLASYAATNHVTLAQLGQANLATAFSDSAQPLIPGALQQTNAPQFCTYVAASADTTDSIAAKFGTTAATLTALNQGLPGLLNGADVVPGGRWICPPMQADAHGLNSLQTLKGLATAYNILSGGQPDVATLAQANAATLGLLAAQLSLPQWGLTTSENETFNSLVNRLAAKNILTSHNTAYTVSDVALALAETPDLVNPAAVVTPVPPVAVNSNEVAITPRFTQAVIPLAVNVTTTRDSQWVDPDFANVSSVSQAVTSIRPEPDQVQGGETNAPFTFNQFANALQTAIKGLFVATGSPPAEGDSPNANTFWAVNLGNPAGPQLNYQFNGGDTEYFALPPLSTSLQGGTVNIKPYVSGQTPPLSGPEQAQTFKAVDMDVWLDTFLQGIDLFLSPAYAVPAYALSPDDVTSVITDKKNLAQKLSQLVTWVLQGPQQTSLHDAQAAMQQALLTQLSSAFTVDTLVQVPVTVTSNTTDPLMAPRLSGKVGLADGTSQQLPNAFSFSTAKVALTNGAATATFLFSVKAPASSKDAALDLQYNVTELELPDPHAVIGDYEGSSWLKFLQPLPVQFETSSSLIGNVDIPIPLRAYPSPLLMVAQTATASYPDPGNTDDLVRWDATTTWAHQDADQDEIALRMEVATSDPGALNRTLDTTDSDALFAALAQFIAVWPAVSNDLARLTTRAPDAPPDPIASGALAAFAMMVDAVTTVWPAALLAAEPRPAADNVAAEILPGTYEYTLLRQLDSEPDLSTLTVIANAANPATLWPEFAVDDGSGNGMQPLTLTSSTSSQAIYTYPANVPKGQSLTYSLTLPKLDVVMIPDFELSASVTRNADLVSTPTNSLFIYSTPYIGFPSPLIPLLVVGEDFPIGSGSTEQLESALTTFFEGLLDRPTTPGTKRTLRVAGSYGYQITQGVSAGAASAVRGLKSAIAANKVELVPRLPIVLVPTVELEINGDNNASIAAFAKNLSDFIVQWDGQVQPSHANASLFFDVCLFSANAGSNNKPLLIVSSVQYSLE
jgi:LysM repeat protein